MLELNHECIDEGMEGDGCVGGCMKSLSLAVVLVLGLGLLGCATGAGGGERSPDPVQNPPVPAQEPAPVAPEPPRQATEPVQVAPAPAEAAPGPTELGELVEQKRRHFVISLPRGWSVHETESGDFASISRTDPRTGPSITFTVVTAIRRESSLERLISRYQFKGHTPEIVATDDRTGFARAEGPNPEHPDHYDIVVGHWETNDHEQVIVASFPVDKKEEYRPLVDKILATYRSTAHYWK
jgi:hypothetical protein